MATSTQSFQFANIAVNGVGFIVKGGIPARPLPKRPFAILTPTAIECDTLPH
jgi:hypothetical protein